MLRNNCSPGLLFSCEKSIDHISQICGTSILTTVSLFRTLKWRKKQVVSPNKHVTKVQKQSEQMLKNVNENVCCGAYKYTGNNMCGLSDDMYIAGQMFAKAIAVKKEQPITFIKKQTEQELHTDILRSKLIWRPKTLNMVCNRYFHETKQRFRMKELIAQTEDTVYKGNSENEENNIMKSNVIYENKSESYIDKANDKQKNICSYSIFGSGEFQSCRESMPEYDYPTIGSILSATSSIWTKTNLSNSKMILKKVEKKYDTRHEKKDVPRHEKKDVPRHEKKHVPRHEKKYVTKPEKEHLYRLRLLYVCMNRTLLSKELTVPQEIRSLYLSTTHVLNNIHGVKVWRRNVVHPELRYRGTVDCIAKYGENRCLIFWKVSKKKKTGPFKVGDALTRMSAIIGAVNASDAFPFILRRGLLIIVHSNGDPASIFEVTEQQLAICWNFWLPRLQQFNLSRPI